MSSNQSGLGTYTVDCTIGAQLMMAADCVRMDGMYLAMQTGPILSSS